jgi:hypothetical protein
MDHFRIRASAYNCKTESGVLSPIMADEQVYYWLTSGDHKMKEDEGKDPIWTTSGTNLLDIVFDNDYYNFDLAWLVLYGWAWDWDFSGNDENTFGMLELPGKRLIMENSGDPSLLIESSDFRFRAFMKIEILI